MYSPKAEVVPQDLTHVQQKGVPTFWSYSDQIEGQARFTVLWAEIRRTWAAAAISIY